MPKQKQDVYAAIGPAIAFNQANQKWNILKGVNVVSGQNPAILSEGFAGITLVNKGNVLGPTTDGGASSVTLNDSDNATIENRETGYIGGFGGVFIGSSASVTFLNWGQVFAAEDALRAGNTDALTVENHGAMSGINAAVSITNISGLSGPLIENFGTMKGQDVTISLDVVDATATIKNKAGGLIENTGDGFAINVNEGRLKLNNKGTIDGTIVAAEDDNDNAITNHGEIVGKGSWSSILTNDGDDTVTNTGKIVHEGNPTPVVTGSGEDTVTNKGTIAAGGSAFAVRTGDDDDTVINEGIIEGKVNLGDGDDVYKNKGGKVNGRIDPESGNDKLVLGKSKDQIEFDDNLDAATNVDRVKNFESGKDKFFLDGDEFTGLTLGTLQKSEFTRGTEAKGNAPQVIYDKPNGLLWFDDGAGGDSQILFARLDDGTKLKHDDFFVFD
ncbi:hypothetical protein [Bauldia sp.]|uniref:hypothetical protein n=1 Tax=Bauldia sp. TaxID=2575872 RepID=UPI003BABC83F